MKFMIRIDQMTLMHIAQKFLQNKKRSQNAKKSLLKEVITGIKTTHSKIQ